MSRRDTIRRLGFPIIQGLRTLRYRLEKEIHPLQVVCLELTSRCNLKRRHCYARAGDRRTDAELRLGAIVSIVDSVISEFGQKVKFGITDGEPRAASYCARLSFRL